MKTKVVVIAGPTAVGKTDLSLQLAKKFNGEIINGDAYQVYQEMNIGTAKILPEEQDGIPHHLLNIRTIEETYTASDFQRDGRKAIEDISNRLHLPIIVGGTGFYLESLIVDMSLGHEAGIHDDFRQEWKKKVEKEGLNAPYEALKRIDPKAAKEIHPHNVRRVIRALEVSTFSKTLFSEQQAEKEELYDAFWIGLTTDRARLYERINLRFDLMIQKGLLEEVRQLYDQASSPYLQSLKAIGYKEFFPYFEGKISLEEAVSQAKKNSRHYAKRQLTWMKHKMKNLHTYDLLQNPETKEIEQEVMIFLKERDYD